MYNIYNLMYIELCMYGVSMIGSAPWGDIRKLTSLIYERTHEPQ